MTDIEWWSMKMPKAITLTIVMIWTFIKSFHANEAGLILFLLVLIKFMAAFSG